MAKIFPQLNDRKAEVGLLSSDSNPYKYPNKGTFLYTDL